MKTELAQYGWIDVRTGPIATKSCFAEKSCDGPGDIVVRQGRKVIVAIDYIRYGYIMGRMSKSEPTLPLTPAVFHILLALFGKERHGYDIMQQVRADSGDAVKMGPGTLYGSLDRMIETGLVAKGNTEDPRRIYYRLTALGQTTLRAETERLSRVARVARRQLGTT
jgi:DNA-binding MarR family transcriptional regulator